MSNYNPRTFTSLGLLRSIPAALLHQFFTPYRAYLESQKFEWPADPETLDHKVLHETLLKPAGPTPNKNLADAMFIVHEMADDAGVSALVDAIREKDPAFTKNKDVEAAVFVIQRWLLDPVLVENTTARRLLAVTGLRVVLELRGLSCLALEELAPPKKAICCAKGFGSPLSTLDELGEPLAAYVSRVAEKLRAQRQVAGFLQVFLETNPHGGGPQYFPATGCALPMPGNDSGRLAEIAAGLLRRIHRPGFSFRKVGVLASDLGPETATQLSFDAPPPEVLARRRALMATMDRLNRDHGRATVRLGSAGPATPAWKMRQANLSPCYTTRWEALLTVSA